MSVYELMRPNIQRLEPYKCARDEAGPDMDVYLDANENYAPVAGEEGINRYPDSAAARLRAAAEQVLGIPASLCTVGNGSDELIDILIRIFCIPGRDSILVMPPTYGEYSVLASVNDVAVIKCPLTREGAISQDAYDLVRKERPKLSFICSPNNPTGLICGKEDILAFAKENPGITVVDQAYIDFAPAGAITADDVRDNERLVVLRTMSKAWALAGARVGFMMSCEEIRAKAYDVKYPYNVGLPAMGAALQALASAEAVRARTCEIIRLREWMRQRIAAIPAVIEVLPSDANFFLVRFEDPGAVYRALKDKGIVVRDRSRELYCQGCLRISVGSQEEDERLVRALEEILA